MKNRFVQYCIIFFCIIFCWLSSLSGETNQTSKIPWSILNGDGKTEEAISSNYRLKDATGQPIIGTYESATDKAYAGFIAEKVTDFIANQSRESSVLWTC